MPFPSRAVWHVVMWALAGSAVVAACSSSKSPSDGGSDTSGSGGQGGGSAGTSGASRALTGGHAAGAAAGGAGGQVDAGACRMQGESCNPPQYCCGVGMISGAGVSGIDVRRPGPERRLGRDRRWTGVWFLEVPFRSGLRSPKLRRGHAADVPRALRAGGHRPAGWTRTNLLCVEVGFIGGPGCVPPPSSCTPQSPFCADVPASCGGRPSCTCLPADICKGNGSCGSVYTSGDVMCGFA